MYKNEQLQSPQGVDIEAAQVWPESNFRSSNGQLWKEKWILRGLLVLTYRASALLFSFITFFLLVTIDFTYSSDLCYIFSIAIIVMVYTMVFVGIKGHELRTGHKLIPHNVAVWLDYLGDQILALMMLSAASSAASANIIAESVAKTQVTSHATGAISIGFSVFFSLQSAAAVSGYHFALHLSNSY